MPTLWLAVLYTHVLAMAFFVGGQLVLAAAIVPVERQAPDPPRMRAVARRFGVGSLLALVILLATGAAMAAHFQVWGSQILQVKLGLVAVVIALTALHLRYPRLHAIQGAVLLVTLAIVWLGLDLAT